MRFGVRQEVWEWYFEPYSHRKSNIWFFFWIFCRRVPTVEVEAGAYMYQGDEAFSRNPLHDLESLCQWWEGLWFLLCHYQPEGLEPCQIISDMSRSLARLYSTSAMISSVDVARSRSRAQPYLPTPGQTLFPRVSCTLSLYSKSSDINPSLTTKVTNQRDVKIGHSSFPMCITNWWCTCGWREGIKE